MGFILRARSHLQCTCGVSIHEQVHPNSFHFGAIPDLRWKCNNHLLVGVVGNRQMNIKTQFTIPSPAKPWRQPSREVRFLHSCHILAQCISSSAFENQNKCHLLGKGRPPGGGGIWTGDDQKEDYH